MNIVIPVPCGSSASFISLCDVVRIESRTLSFFESSMHNLYIVMKLNQQEDEFSLYTYHQEKDMLLAYDLIADQLNRKAEEPITLAMRPMAS